MCGIFGIYSDNNIDINEFKLLASLSERRGRDSSGLLYLADENYLVTRADFRVGKLLSQTNII